MSDEQEHLNDKVDDGFAIPTIPKSIPFKKPIIDLNDKSTNQQSISSSNNESNNQQSSQLSNQQQDVDKKLSFPPPLTTLQPIKDFFYVEIIKDGTMVKREYLNKNFILIGRAVDCDLIFEHCSISRYHSAFYWKENSQNTSDNGFFYLTDLASTHGTFHNRTQLEQNKFLKLEPNKSFIKLGASTRLLLFNCIEENEEADTSSNQSYSVSNQQKQQTKLESTDCECMWGMDSFDSDLAHANSSQFQSESGLQTVLSIINENIVIDKTENENAYSQNPQKAIQNWFDYEGYEYEYTISNDNNKFKCTIEFPIDGQYIPISGEDELKKKDAIISTCLRACRILDKSELLFAWQKSNRIAKRKDDSDEEDELIDETGEKEIKKMRSEAMKKVENLDTLNKRFDELKMEIETLKTEIAEIDQQMGASKIGSKDKNDDELDHFMKSMSSNKYSLNDLKIQKSKGRMKMSQLIKEKDRIQRLIKIAMPSPATYKIKTDTLKSSKANEFLEKAMAKLSEKKLETIQSNKDLSNDEKTQQVEVIVTNDKNDLNQNDDSKEKNDEINIKQTKKSFTIKPTVKESNLKPIDKKNLVLMQFDESVEEKAKLSKVDFGHKDDEFKRISKHKLSEIDDSEDKHTNTDKPQPSKPKKQKFLRRDEDESIEDNDKFVEWIPDQANFNESDDCKSYLNEKYGY